MKLKALSPGIGTALRGELPVEPGALPRARLEGLDSHRTGPRSQPRQDFNQGPLWDAGAVAARENRVHSGALNLPSAASAVAPRPRRRTLAETHGGDAMSPEGASIDDVATREQDPISEPGPVVGCRCRRPLNRARGMSACQATETQGGPGNLGRARRSVSRLAEHDACPSSH